jgi:hypothetical protein
LRKKEAKGKGRRKKENGDVGDVAVPLIALTDSHWAKSLDYASIPEDRPSFQDQVVEEALRLVEACPEDFDIPILPALPLKNSQCISLPFLASTWDLLKSKSLDDEDSLNRLLGGTYQGLFEQLGSLGAVLDISITAQSWTDHRFVKGIMFRQPRLPATDEEFLGLMRERVFRHGGRSVDGKYYKPSSVDAFTGRWGVTLLKPWTLEQVGVELGLTRERIRQIMAGINPLHVTRRWPLPSSAKRLATLLSEGSGNKLVVEWHGDLVEVRREDATRFLVFCGINEATIAPFNGIEGKLAGFGLDLKTVRSCAYWASGRMGLIQRDLAVDKILEEFEGVSADLIAEAISYVSSTKELPFGYVIVENQGLCFLVTALQSVLSKNGALPIAELYDALVRFFIYRTPGRIFPPQRVVEAFLIEDARFVVEAGEVRLKDPHNKHIGDTYEWMWQEIAAAPGLVMHRSELLQRGRETKHNASTLNVYFSYSTYFKPVGGNCITLTGCFPKDSDVSFAKARASAISVPTRCLGWSSKGSLVEVRVEVGNYFLDTGLLSLPAACKRIIGQQPYAIFWGDESRGNAGWSGGQFFGWSSVLSFGSISPGDEITLIFDLNTRKVFVALSEDLFEDPEI